MDLRCPILIHCFDEAVKVVRVHHCCHQLKTWPVSGRETIVRPVFWAWTTMLEDTGVATGFCSAAQHKQPVAGGHGSLATTASVTLLPAHAHFHQARCCNSSYEHSPQTASICCLLFTGKASKEQQPPSEHSPPPSRCCKDW